MTSFACFAAAWLACSVGFVAGAWWSARGREEDKVKPEMTVELARAAATDAGRRHAINDGRPPAPWTREDYDAAVAEFNRLCREFKLSPWKLP